MVLNYEKMYISLMECYKEKLLTIELLEKRKIKETSEWILEERRSIFKDIKCGCCCSTYTLDNNDGLWNFCPNCGRVMLNGEGN